MIDEDGGLKGGQLLAEVLERPSTPCVGSGDDQLVKVVLIDDTRHRGKAVRTKQA